MARESDTPIDRRKFLKAGAASGMAAWLAGCSQADDSSDPNTDSNSNDGGDTSGEGSGSSDDGEGKSKLAVALPAEQSSLDPANQYTSYGAEWVYSLYSGLLRVDYDWESETFQYGVPDLAKSWEQKQEDGEWIVQFKLRDGVQFHNGDKLDAELVKKEVEYWFEESTSTGSTLAPILAEDQRVSIDNDMTVNLHLGDEPFAPFAMNFSGLLANPYVREERGVGNFATDASDGGSGPYKFVSYDSGSNLVLERYDDYYQEGVPTFEQIEFKILPEGSTRVAQLETGAIDLDNFIQTRDWKSLEGNDEISTPKSPASMWGCTIFNHNANEAFQDSRVRRALSMAVERSSYNEAIFSGLGTPVSLPSIADTWWGFPDINSQNLHNLEQAKQLMEEAGYADGFEMTLQAGSDSWHQTMAQVTSNMFSKLNVDVTIEPMEPQTMWTEIAQGNYTAAVSENLGSADPDHFIYNYCHPDGPWTTITQGWEDNIKPENEHVFDLLEQQRAETDQQKRRGIVEEIYQILADEMPYHFYVNGVNVAAHQPELTDYWLYPGDYSREALRTVGWE